MNPERNTLLLVHIFLREVLINIGNSCCKRMIGITDLSISGSTSCGIESPPIIMHFGKHNNITTFVYLLWCKLACLVCKNQIKFTQHIWLINIITDKKVKEGSETSNKSSNDTFDMSTNMTFSFVVDKLKLLIGEIYRKCRH